MQRDNRHHSKGKGKGKGKEKEKGFDQRFGELKLESPAESSTPRSGQPELPYPQSAHYSTYDQYPSGNEYTYQRRPDDNNASTAAYSGYGGHETYAATFPNHMDGTSSSGMNAPRGSNSSYDGTYSTTTGGGASSYTDSTASSSYAASVSSTWSSNPPKYEAGSLNHHIAQQPPPNNRGKLPCEFRMLLGCPIEFEGGEEREWKDHIEEHLESKFPTSLQCWFCRTFTFNARDHLSCGDKRHNFGKRMDHIRDHIVNDGCQVSNMVPDGGLIKHLRKERLISTHEYNDILARITPKAAPPVPGGSSGGTLEQVIEEPASSSSRTRHREKKKYESSRRHSGK